jgi:glucosamine-6-phosphate deaminase
LYAELGRLHKEDGLSFKNVHTFNLDEYYPMQPEALQSYVRFMREHLFDHIDIPKKNINIPDGTVSKQEIANFCRGYEEKIDRLGGLDVQVLGIGRTGHIGFNEPGSAEKSHTRLVSLDQVTRIDAASDFFGEENVPTKAVTMGVGSIMKAAKVYMMAWGEGKAAVIHRAVEGPITDQIPSSFLQKHQDCTIVVDGAAASGLTRVKTPWVLDIVDWNERLIRKAVVWLCQEIQKPVLKLTNHDYMEHGMGDIITEFGSAYQVNIKVFNYLQHTITGWPGGKPKADDSHRPERAKPFPKRVIIFSPHPDDDVISMGGTFIRLVDQGHEVHVAYQTSGNIAGRLRLLRDGRRWSGGTPQRPRPVGDPDRDDQHREHPDRVFGGALSVSGHRIHPAPRKRRSRVSPRRGGDCSGDNFRRRRRPLVDGGAPSARPVGTERRRAGRRRRGLAHPQ